MERLFFAVDENKPSLEGEGVSLPLKLLPCRNFGDARESWPSL